MPEYIVTISRTREELAEITIIAPTESEAETKALELAESKPGDLEWSTETDDFEATEIAEADEADETEDDEEEEEEEDEEGEEEHK